MSLRNTPNTSLVQGLLLIGAVALLLFAPLMVQVWKEGEVVQYARLRDESQHTLDALNDECVVLESRIQKLSAVARLSAYGKDSLGLMVPMPEQVVVVRRRASGELIAKKITLWIRLKRWVQRK